MNKPLFTKGDMQRMRQEAYEKFMREQRQKHIDAQIALCKNDELKSICTDD